MRRGACSRLGGSALAAEQLPARSENGGVESLPRRKEQANCRLASTKNLLVVNQSSSCRTADSFANCIKSFLRMHLCFLDFSIFLFRISFEFSIFAFAILLLAQLFLFS